MMVPMSTTHIILYGIPNCDTVKKARAWLTGQGLDHTFHDFKKQGVPAERLPDWLKTVGREKLLNTKGVNGTSLNEVTRSLNVTKGAFYHYFSSKDELLFQCYYRSQELVERYIAAVQGYGCTGLEMLQACTFHNLSIQLGSQGPLTQFNGYKALPAYQSDKITVRAAIAGAGLAFLWFNAYPAQVFMGDVGALALGGALGTIAVIVRQEIVLAIMGGIFVVEALSVMLQVTWFKYTKKRYGEGRRLLKMAPLHHHFEKSGWKETQVVIRFWIITMLLCLIGLSTLKLR